MYLGIEYPLTLILSPMGRGKGEGVIRKCYHFLCFSVSFRGERKNYIAKKDSNTVNSLTSFTAPRVSPVIPPIFFLT